MRNASLIFILSVLCACTATAAWQAPAAAAPAQPAPSTLLKPSLEIVQLTVSQLKLEKWKRGDLREEARDNVGAILRDINDTLPPLLHDADAASASISKSLPVSRNVSALYDVLLRVEIAARLIAPTEQDTSIEQALSGLKKARGAFDDRMLEAATAQEKQVHDLRATVQAQASVKCPAPPPAPACPAPAPVKKVKKPAPKPATPAPQTTTPATPAPTTPKP
jgi:hypothetical protein